MKPLLLTVSLIVPHGNVGMGWVVLVQFLVLLQCSFIVILFIRVDVFDSS